MIGGTAFLGTVSPLFSIASFTSIDFAHFLTAKLRFAAYGGYGRTRGSAATLGSSPLRPSVSVAEAAARPCGRISPAGCKRKRRFAACEPA